MTSFVAGGALALEGAARVSRRFEQQAFDTLVAGRWVVLRGPRQHGKTSGLIWLKGALIDAGIDCARLTLQELPPGTTYDDLLTRLTRGVAEQSDVDLDDAEPSPTLEDALARAMPPGNAEFALLLDEVSGVVRQEWRDRFFGDLRSLSDRSADAPVGSVAKRLLALFAGTFLTDDLISPDHPNSPFNTCVELDTDDLSLEQALALASDVAGNEVEEFIEPAYELVGGQPYLLQHLFGAAWQGSDPAERRELFDDAAAQLRAGRGQHIRHLFNRILDDDDLSTAFQQLVASEDGIPVAPTRGHELLVVIGAARVDGIQLRVRNALYLEVGRRHPLLTPTPALAPATSVPPSVGTLDFMHDAQLREIARSMAEGGLAAQAEGRHRFAVAGLGTALEAILVDHLTALEPAELQAAVGAASPNFNNWEDAATASTWRLVNLVKVAERTDAIDAAIGRAFDAVREWRNLIHPGKALENYLSDDELQPESAAAAALLGMLVRSLS